MKDNKNIFPFSIGDRCIDESGRIIIIETEPDEFSRVNFECENGGGGHMGRNHWQRLMKAPDKPSVLSPCEIIPHDIRTELMICPKCDGKGWFEDHSDVHHWQPSLDCVSAGCPIQRECEVCGGTGMVWKKDMEHKEPMEDDKSDDDLPF